MCHHREFRTEWERATDDEEPEDEVTPDVDYDEAEDVEILTDGGDGDE